ncbi:hypothetical protein RE6C_01430 [Rhodopirellula europaea 6C]|uniref:Uncharacterized protein n=1 Tax=Rhodopirellula europaea 6C TaxID=1263867 RepID=M2B6F3_9BACT|nr:hypothetical protein RE6C_01430 [Rhodopirellula europaea 6C]
MFTEHEMEGNLFGSGQTSRATLLILTFVPTAGGSPDRLSGYFRLRSYQSL